MRSASVRGRFVSLAIAGVSIFFGVAARAVETKVDVRVMAKGAKFIGTTMGGADIQIRDAATGDLLSRGKTVGSTGSTAKTMTDARPHHAAVSTPDAAVFHATLDIVEPIQVEITARGPLAQPQAIAKATTTLWVVPGKDLTGGDGVLLELPGFVVGILSPAAHSTIRGAHEVVSVDVSVTMMCGCPIEPGGLWDAEAFEVVALVTHNESMKHWPVKLKYAGEANRFEGDIETIAPGAYEVTVYAYDPANGNTGLDKTTFILGD